MEFTYTVTTTIQSKNIDENEPVEVRWYRGSSLAGAMAAMVQAAADHEDKASHLPESVQYRTHNVNLTIEEA